MLRAIIKQELVDAIDLQDFLDFNAKHGQYFLDTIGFHVLGGLSLSLYGNQMYGLADQQTLWKHGSYPLAKLDLSCGAPVAVVGMPFLHQESVAALGPFIRHTGREFVDTAKILLPLSGVEIHNPVDALT